jgi:hypothetical protein
MTVYARSPIFFLPFLAQVSMMAFKIWHGKRLQYTADKVRDFGIRMAGTGR